MEAFWLPWVRRRAFFKALFLPSMAILAVQVGLRRDEAMSTGASAWMVMIVMLLLWILFAVACHRLVLLDPQVRDVPFVPGWGLREMRFLGCILLITAVTWGAVMAVLMAYGIVVGSISPGFFETSQGYIGGLVGIYFFARMGPVLPAAAIDAPIDFKEMWHKTRGNTWRLVVIVGVLPWIFGYVSAFLGGGDEDFFRAVATTLLGAAFLAIEVSALSVSYRRLNELSEG